MVRSLLLILVIKSCAASVVPNWLCRVGCAKSVKQLWLSKICFPLQHWLGSIEDCDEAFSTHNSITRFFKSHSMSHHVTRAFNCTITNMHSFTLCTMLLHNALNPIICHTEAQELVLQTNHKSPTTEQLANS